MKNKMNKTISLILFFVVLFSLMPIGAFAAEEDVTYPITGSCGDSATWLLDEAGVLTISGEGAMNYSGSSPWFDDRDKINSIVIGDGISNIKSYAFQYCTNLKSVTIGKTVKEIEDNAFLYCTSVVKVVIPDNVTSIGKQAFYNCHSITQVEVGNGITNIGEDAFGCCYLLKSVNIKDLNSWIGIDFVNLGSNPLNYAGGSIYVDSELLTEITFDESITKIKDYSFYNCSSLESVVMHDEVTSIGKHAFYNCILLKNVVFGDGLEVIERNAFYRCKSLTALELPDSIKIIGQGAFGSTAITKFIAPKNITSISNGLLDNCLYLTEVILHSNIDSIGPYAFYGCKELDTMLIPDSVQSIGKCAFAQCKGLSKVTLPKDIVRLEDYLFENCISLNDVKLPENLNYIGDNTFSYCAGLTSIYIPDTVTHMGTGVFMGCGSLLEANIPNNIIKIPNNTFYNCKKLQEFEISENITCIGKEAFYSCESLLNITIPENVKEIKEGAFAYCGGLKNINVPKGITVIENSVFEATSSLESIVLPEGIKSLGRYAFRYSGIKHIEIPNTVEKIDTSAFGVCRNLESIIIPDSIKSIGDNAFRQCSNLETVVLSNSIDVIEIDAFYACTSLNSIVIPEGVTTIKESAFGNCGKLNSIILPKSLENIKAGAFIKCENIKHFAYRGSNFSAITIGDRNSAITIQKKHQNVTKVAHCNNEAFYCPSCDWYYDVTTGKKLNMPYGNHDVVTDNYLSPTYTSVGLTEGIHCGVCNETIVEQKTIPMKKLPAPTSVKAASAGYNSIKISWKKVSGASGYSVYRSTSKTGKYTFVKMTTNTSYTNSGRTTGTKYYYKVRPYVVVDGERKYGDYSAVVSGKALPAKPTGVKAVSAGYKSIKISWKKVSGASGYEVYRSTSKNGTYSLVSRTKKTYLTNTGRATGKKYYYKVRAYRTVNDVRKYGSFSSIVSAKAVTATPEVTLKKVSSTKAKVSWKKVTGATGYEVYYSTSKTGTYTRIARTANLSYTKSSLKKGKTYYFKVRAYRTVNGVKKYGSYSTVKKIKMS